jgi:hypothetical protein
MIEEAATLTVLTAMIEGPATVTISTATIEGTATLVVMAGRSHLDWRVVARYGFKEYARTYVYAWMPVIDLDVIRSLVPDE